MLKKVTGLTEFLFAGRSRKRCGSRKNRRFLRDPQRFREAWELTWEQGEERRPSQREPSPKFHKPTQNQIDGYLKGGQHRIFSGSLASPPRHEKCRKMFILPL